MCLSREQLTAYVNAHTPVTDAQDIQETDCGCIEFLLDNCEITVPPENEFFVRVNCGAIMYEVTRERAKACIPAVIEKGLMEGDDALAFTGTYDFSHTTADWETVASLGFFGLRERIVQYAGKYGTDTQKKQFYARVLRIYDAILRFLKRAAEEAARCGKTKMAEGLRHLSERCPLNLSEAMQTVIGYYVIQTLFEGTYLRTMGRLDRVFYPFFIREDKAEARNLAEKFLQEIDGLEVPANMPFAIGGTDINGMCLVNELSYLLLDVYRNGNTANTKLHILCSENMPADILEKAFSAIRDGKNSIVFVSDEKTIEILEKLGEDREDAVNYHIVGCYECGGYNEVACSSNGRVNIPKALEFALNFGKDMLTGAQLGLSAESTFETYEQLFSEFKRQVQHLCRCSMAETDIFEGQYSRIHSSPIFSGMMTSSLEKGGDVYCEYTAKYNNSSINAIGLATAVDSLAAIRKLVFEDKSLSLPKLREILLSDWEGEEVRRLFIKNKFPKFGMGDKETDAIAKEIVDVLAEAICGKPNAKGGVYRLGLLSINNRWYFGEKTGASPDGRKSGETLSQNASATFGADREGTAGHLLSTAAIDYTNVPNGTVVDIDLHRSAVQGENGIKTMVAALRTHFALGGFAVHYNVLDTEILQEAKLHPEKYPNLQVRLCGWNVLFSSLSEKEQDEFIARSIK